VEKMSHPQECIGRIHANYASFSKTEKRIADYILQHPENIVHKTIDQVAEDLNVAISTVFRFTKTLGFKGFQAMKIALATEISDTLKEIVQEKVEEMEEEQAITEKIFQNNIRMFKETIQVMDYGALKKAVNKIVASNRVEFYGIGSAGLVALDAHHRFLGTGISTAAYTDYHLQLRASAQLTEKDVAIFITDHSTEDETIRIIDVAKDAGAIIVVITNYSNSRLAQKADILLKTVSTHQDPRSEDSFTRIIQLSLIDSLYANVLSAKKDSNKGPFEKLKKYWGLT
jgi:RpiR family transcriptional regulator, carbohydrate utilization regulator